MCLFQQRENVAQPDFSKHAASFKCDEHDGVVRSSDHLHRSTFDDVHLFTDVALQGGAESYRANYKSSSD